MMTTKVRSLLFWDIFFFFPNEQINAVSSDWLYGMKQKKSRFPLIAMRFLFVFSILVIKPKFVLQILKMNLAKFAALRGKKCKMAGFIENHNSKEKGRGKQKEQGGRKEPEKEWIKDKLLVFTLATFVGPQKYCLTESIWRKCFQKSCCKNRNVKTNSFVFLSLLSLYV